MKKSVLKIHLLFSLLTLSFFAFGQAESPKSNTKIYNWDVTLKGGASLLWGDAASSYSPFTKWFSNECAFTGEIVINRRLSNVFGIQAGFAKGVLSGYREVWTPETHPLTTSKTDFFDYHLGLNVDITGFFNHNPNRFFSLYAFGGIGMMNYTAVSYLDGKVHESATGNTLIIPWGGGARFRLSPRFSILLETNFRNTFIDDIDAYVGSGSEVNDIYSITSVGLSYRFGQKKDKKREIEIVPVVAEDTLLAKDDLNDQYVPIDVVVNRGMPVTAISDTTYIVQVQIQKDSLNDFGQYSQEIPLGFIASEDNSHGGTFQFDGKSMIIEWQKMPSAEQLEFSYKLSTHELEVKTYAFEGEFRYYEDTATRVRTFVDNIVVETVQNKQLTTDDSKSQNLISGVDYRVQIAAVFGGKSSSDVIAKRLNVSEEVFEDPYNRGYRYTVGHHNDYKSANAHRRNVSVKGAYVIAFVDGEYVGDLAKTNEIIMDKNAFNTEGVTYKIQIAASKGRAYSIAKLANKYDMSPEEIYQDAGGVYYKYSVGKFTSLDDAKAALSSIKSKVKSAYIVKFIDGKYAR